MDEAEAFELVDRVLPHLVRLGRDVLLLVAEANGRTGEPHVAVLQLVAELGGHWRAEELLAMPERQARALEAAAEGIDACDPPPGGARLLVVFPPEEEALPVWYAVGVDGSPSHN